MVQVIELVTGNASMGCTHSTATTLPNPLLPRTHYDLRTLEMLTDVHMHSPPPHHRGELGVFQHGRGVPAWLCGQLH